MELSDQQLAAVRHEGSPALVVAGAGSGKTRTLTAKFVHLIENGVDSSRVLAITFTRKAAQQMLQRATRLLDRRCENVAGGTFHSFGNLILRKYASALGLSSSFAIFS